MEVRAITKNVRLSHTKMQDLARELSGKPVADALCIVDFNKRKAALLIGKTLRSAIANAINNDGLDEESLMVKSVVIDRGPQMRRYWAGARGMAKPIKHRMSHIRVTLSDDAKPARKA